MVGVAMQRNIWLSLKNADIPDRGLNDLINKVLRNYLAQEQELNWAVLDAKKKSKDASALDRCIRTTPNLDLDLIEAFKKSGGKNLSTTLNKALETYLISEGLLLPPPTETEKLKELLTLKEHRLKSVVIVRGGRWKKI